MDIGKVSTVRGIRNNNPFNIRKGNNWKGERPNQTDKEFEEFISMEYGIRAGLRLILNHITGFRGKRKPMNTVRKLITTWAPPSENNTERYIETVCRAVPCSSFAIIDPKDKNTICKIARAMVAMECGVWMDEKVFESAWFLL